MDYIITIGEDIIPVEVKSGATGKLKSLKLFMEEKKSKLGIQISQKPVAFNNQILSVPFYLIHELPRLIKSVLC